MVQSRLQLYADSLWTDRIAGDLFVQSNDAEICLPAEGLHVVGAERIQSYYKEAHARTLQNGKTLGTNQGTGQYIRIEPDGDRAVGRWYTYTVFVEAGAYGHSTPPYPYRLNIGRYENEFAKVNNVWKLKKLYWEPVLALETYDCYPSAGGNVHKDADCWITPYISYDRRAVGPGNSGAKEQGMTETWDRSKGCPVPGMDCETLDTRTPADREDAWSRAVLEIQNLHGAFIHHWNTGRFTEIYEQLYARTTQDISFESQGFPGRLEGRAVRNVFGQMQRRADMLGGFYGIQLSTSRVIEIHPDGRHARGMWTSLTLDASSRDTEREIYQLDNATGRWYIDFIRESDGWKIKDYQWKAFAYMSSMKGRRVG